MVTRSNMRTTLKITNFNVHPAIYATNVSVFIPLKFPGVMYLFSTNHSKARPLDDFLLKLGACVFHVELKIETKLFFMKWPLLSSS